MKSVESRTRMEAPTSQRRPSYQPQSSLYDRRYALVPIGVIAFMVIVAVTLIFKVIVTAPDTHTNLWNETREGYSRTEVAFIAPAATPPPNTTGEVSFAHDVLPIFRTKCSGCHGLGISLGGIALTSHSDITNPDNQRQLVVPGAPDESLIIEVLRRSEGVMPPTGRLPEEQIETIEKWIEEGAKNN